MNPISPEAAAEATSSLVKSGVLGALVVLLAILNVWLLIQLIKIQNLRVADTDKAASSREASNEKDRATYEKVATSVSDLARGITDIGKAVERNTNATDNTTKSIEGVVLAAVRGRFSGQMQAVKDPTPRKPPLPREE